MSSQQKLTTFSECEIRDAETGMPTGKYVMVCDKCDTGCLVSQSTVLLPKRGCLEGSQQAYKTNHVFCPCCKDIGDVDEDVLMIDKAGVPIERQIPSDDERAEPMDPHMYFVGRMRKYLQSEQGDKYKK